MKNEIMFDKNVKFRRTPSRIRTRFIAVFALGTALATFISGFFVFLYMKSPRFEKQLTGQVIKQLDWIIANEFEKPYQVRSTLQLLGSL